MPFGTQPPAAVAFHADDADHHIGPNQPFADTGVPVVIALRDLAFIAPDLGTAHFQVGMHFYGPAMSRPSAISMDVPDLGFLCCQVGKIAMMDSGFSGTP